jgi:hypothetical protein
MGKGLKKKRSENVQRLETIDNNPFKKLEFAFFKKVPVMDDRHEGKI